MLKGRWLIGLSILAVAVAALVVFDARFYDLDSGIIRLWSEALQRDDVEIGFADVTGDGRADAIMVLNNGIVIRRSQGDRFEGNEVWKEGDYQGDRGTFFADVDGDGRADVVSLRETGITVCRATLQGLTDPEIWANDPTFGPFFGTRRTLLADVDGDRRADVVMVNEDGIIVRPSKGNNFGRAQPWIETPFDGDRAFALADVDGDGRADAIAVNHNGIVVRRAQPDRLGDAAIWANDPTYGPFLGDRGNFFADVNGDGRADAVMVNDDNILVRHSKGKSFGRAEFLSYTPFYGEDRTFFVDVTGNGIADAVAVTADEISIRLTTANRKP